MKLFVANCSNQNQTICYRVPEKTGGHSVQTVEIGMQRQLGSDMNRLQMDGVIEQLDRYGMRAADSMQGYALPFVVPCLYSVDTPISAEKMKMMFEYNQGVLIKAGKEMRERAAIATHHGIRDMAPNAAQNLVMSVQEETPGSGDRTGIPATNEGWKIEGGDLPSMN